MMKKRLFQLTKLSLLLGAMLIGNAVQSSVHNNNRTIADNDTIYLRVESTPISYFPISGSIFNAIDSRYLADENGFSMNVFQDGTERKTFRLNTFHYHRIWITSNVIDESSVDRLGAVLSVNYFINDELLKFDSRALVSTLMPQAIERITFTPVPTDSADFVHNHQRRSQDKEAGRVRIYTRDISHIHTVSDEDTLYLLDGIVITPKIFKAIRPVYIRSLERITDRNELNNFSQNNLREVVKIKTLGLSELVVYGWEFSITTGPHRMPVLIVDGIELPFFSRGLPVTYRRFNSDFFKSKQIITRGDRGFNRLQWQFPGKNHFTIITL